MRLGIEVPRTGNKEMLDEIHKNNSFLNRKERNNPHWVEAFEGSTCTLICHVKNCEASMHGFGYYIKCMVLAATKKFKITNNTSHISKHDLCHTAISRLKGSAFVPCIKFYIITLIQRRKYQHFLLLASAHALILTVLANLSQWWTQGCNFSSTLFFIFLSLFLSF